MRFKDRKDILLLRYYEYLHQRAGYILKSNIKAISTTFNAFKKTLNSNFLKGFV